MGENAWSLVTQLADARLVVTGQDIDRQNTAELVHEALIQHWNRLQQWLEQDRTFRVWQEQLRVSLNQWLTTDKWENTVIWNIETNGDLIELDKVFSVDRNYMISEEPFIFVALSADGKTTATVDGSNEVVVASR